jgi:hypothetical protein
MGFIRARECLVRRFVACYFGSDSVYLVKETIMNRRDVLGALGATVATLGAIASANAQAPKKSEKDADHHDSHFDTCAKACADCQLDCHSCHHHCEDLVAAGKKEHVKTMKLCADCGDICAVAANIVSRHGALSATACEACAKACDECGKHCAQFPDDEHMKKCADECKKCAAACREMVKHAGMQH